jgi:hypothetical protein
VLQFKFGSLSTGNITVQTAGLGFGGGTRENDLFINTSGTVLIGKTADNDTDVGVRIQSNGGTSINRSGGLSANVINTSSGFGLNIAAGGTSSSGNWAFRIEDGGGNAFHHFFSDAVGIGTSSPTSFINTGNFFKPSSSGTAKFLTIDGGTNAANIMLQGNITGENPLGGIYWTSTNGQATGNRQVAAIDVQIDDHSNPIFDGGSLRFFTKPAGGGVQNPRMTLTSGGNLLVGTTSTIPFTFSSGTGAGITNSGTIMAGATAEAGLFNRVGSDGAIIQLYKAGNIVGSVGTKSGDLAIGTGDTGVRFDDANNAIYAHSMSANAYLDAIVDLGYSGIRFKDAHFAGTINTRALTVENDISGDATLRLKSTSQGDPTLIFNSSAANRSGMIRYQDNDTNVGRIEYVHNGDRIDMRAGSATGITASVSNSAFLVGKTAEGDTDGIHFKTDGRGFYDYDGSGQNVLTLGRQSDGNMIQFNQANSIDGTVGTISVSNNATNYATSSDARLKDNIEDAKDSGDIIDKIKVRQFDWKKTGKHQDYGMIAQELILEVPDAVSTPTEDHEMMGIDYSKLVPLMMKEIQNLRKEIKSLKQKEK